MQSTSQPAKPSIAVRIIYPRYRLSRAMANDGDDEVGYGRPPKASRFKPGRSGNPKGRPQKNAQADDQLAMQSVTADVMEELRETITVCEDGRERKFTKQRAFVRALIASAIKGDVRAINAVVTFARQTVIGADEMPPDDDDADLEDLDILESFVERERARRARLEEKSHARPESPQPSNESKDNEDGI